MAGVPVTARTLPCLVERMMIPNESSVTSPCKDYQLRFVLKEGRNRQIRNMCFALGLQVTSLHRVAFAGITLDGCENPGDCADLTEQELLLIGAKTRNELHTPEERAKRKLKKLMKKATKNN